MMVPLCKQCGRELCHDEIALHRRLISTESTEFYCLACLAEYFDCDEKLLRQKIEHFKSMGCTLFKEPGPKTEGNEA